LEQSKYPIVIDDFHYISKNIQTVIVRSLKDSIFDGLPVITLSVPHRMYDSVRVEKEMTGRVEILSVPEWEANELRQIAEAGFRALYVKVADSVIDRLSKEAFQSPHLMQEFCGALCKSQHFYTSTGAAVELSPPENWNTFFRERAAHASKTAFDRLVVGPRQRTDRLQRKLRNGETCDIYKAVLLALAYGGPRATSSYSDIRGWLKEVLEDVPQANEVTAVLQHMSDIAREIEGEPVIDYDKELRQVFLADPFFAFYLRWSTDTALARQLPPPTSQNSGST
jgi:hypothetical protein